MAAHRWISSSAALVLIMHIAGSIVTTSPFLNPVYMVNAEENEDNMVKKDVQKVLPTANLVVSEQVINYAFEIIPATFTDISLAGNNTGIVDDDTSVEIPIGFNFAFYENVYDSVFVSSNGFLTWLITCTAKVLINTYTIFRNNAKI